VVNVGGPERGRWRLLAGLLLLAFCCWLFDAGCWLPKPVALPCAKFEEPYPFLIRIIVASGQRPAASGRIIVYVFMALAFCFLFLAASRWIQGL
jgi:hypothetical protein